MCVVFQHTDPSRGWQPTVITIFSDWKQKNKEVKSYKCFQIQGHVKHNLTEHAYCLLSCRHNSTLNCPFCQAPVP